MPALTLTINGRLVSGRAGETVLQVIRANGFDLPTLCYLEGLTARGGCRLCMVEVSGREKPQAACVTPAEEGMVVTTDTERLRRYRRQIVELLLAERNHICSVCVVNGHCELQSLAARFGIDHVRYRYLFPRLPLDASHRRFGMDHVRCVLCARCVRTCDEVEGVHARMFEDMERELFTRAIQLAQGNQAMAARWLGVTRTTMREKLIHFGLHQVAEKPADVNAST